MAVDFKFPDLGEGVTEGEIKKLVVKEGDTIKQDQPIAEVETDKAVVEMPSPTAGTVLKIYFREGQVIKVGQVLATIGAEGEAVEPAGPALEGPAPLRPPSVSVVGELPVSEEVVSSVQSAVPAEAGGKILATPAVRKLAKDMNLDISKLKGTGPGGRVTEDDVRAAGKGVAPAAEEKPTVHRVPKFDLYGYVDRLPVRGIRRTTAKKMLESSLSTAPVTVMDDADVTDLVAVRERLKPAIQEERKVHLTFLPFVVKAVVMALKSHPLLNAQMDDEGEEILVKKYWNIGVAVAIEDGLMVPVVKAADQKGLIDMAAEIQDLIEKSQSRKIDLGDLKGGTFTITNYGSLGGTYGTPIINFPEAAILGMGVIRELPVVRDGQIVIRKMMPLSLTFDHRILDGAEATRFLADLMKYLSNPELIMAEQV
jgi:pyruvate dehydrogenase E2 component (dihydrolipoamide acetyltransferase)